MTFIPTPKILPVSSVLNNKNNLIRNIKLKFAFLNKVDNFNSKNKTFTERSNWIPNNSILFKNNNLNNFLTLTNKINKSTYGVLDKFKTFEKDGEKFIVLNEKYNLSRLESEAIRRLKSNTDIIIKPADKGGALVVMDKSNYLIECYRQLDDKQYYSKLDKPIYPTNKIKIGKILNNLYNDGYINEKQLQYLSGPIEPKTRKFYILPKIHKDKNTWTIPGVMPQGRPIVCDVDSESYRVSEYVNSFLTPLSVKHKSYLKNSYDFIEKIRNLNIDENTYLVTGDITSLYTNMKHDLTINSIKKVFANNPDKNRPDSYIIDLLEIILSNNDFEFNDSTYLQICGCPMGKIIGPAAANIYLIEFDNNALNNFTYKPLILFRYLDDIFMLWNHGLDKLKLFEDYLNSLIPGITIKLEASLTSANFLDVTVYKAVDNNNSSTNNLKLETKVFFKPTDTHNLLHLDSFHPPHTSRGVLRSQLIRFKRISSNWSNYMEAGKILFHSLTMRGYSWSKLWHQLVDIWFNYTEKTNTQTDNKILPIILEYNSVSKKLTVEYKNILKSEPNLKDYKLITAYKNHQNLQQLLIRNTLRSDRMVENKVFNSKKCCNNKCKACNYIIQDSKFRSSNTLKKFNLKFNFNCKSTSLIYLITCKKCTLQYVGQTTRRLADRITDHISSIKNNKNNPIGIHFNSNNHKLDDFSIIPIDYTVNKNTLDNLEIKWQKILNTIYPAGLNELNFKYQFSE